MRILLTGGGTMGPVAPLLAIARELQKRGIEVIGLVGTKNGPEKKFVEDTGLKFFSISSGKIRRYWDLRNFIAPIAVVKGFFEAASLLRKLKSSVVVSGGSFIGVPVVLAAWFLKIPSIAHQQDIRPSFANLLVVPFVKKITVTFVDTLKFFPKNKAVLTGNPVRPGILQGDKIGAIQKFGLQEGVPTVLVFGGGSGAKFLNDLVWSSLGELVGFCQVIHLTGIDKGNARSEINYHQYEILNEEEMADAYAAADLVVSRAGVGTITELAALGKPAILIPIHESHQEANADFAARADAAIYESQATITPQKFVLIVKNVLNDRDTLQRLSENIRKINNRDSLAAMAELIEASAKK